MIVGEVILTAVEALLTLVVTLLTLVEACLTLVEVCWTLVEDGECDRIQINVVGIVRSDGSKVVGSGRNVGGCDRASPC